MATFQQAQKRARRLTAQQMRDDFFKFLKSQGAFMVEMNQTNILIDSEDIFGNDLGFYSKGTDAITGGRKKEGDPFDLFETGEFLDGFFAEFANNEITFDTTDSKKEKVLENTLSDKIFGLQDENLKRLIDEKLRPYLIFYLNSIL